MLYNTDNIVWEYERNARKNLSVPNTPLQISNGAVRCGEKRGIIAMFATTTDAENRIKDTGFVWDEEGQGFIWPKSDCYRRQVSEK